MFCSKCGKPVNQTSVFCPHCGNKVPTSVTPSTPPVQSPPSPAPVSPPTAVTQLHPHFSWKIGVTIGVAVLVIAGVMLGLILGLSGGRNVEGIYVWKDTSTFMGVKSDLVETLILKPNGVQTLKSNNGRDDDGTYTGKDNKVEAVWKANVGKMKFTIVDGNLVDEQSEVWTRQ